MANYRPLLSDDIVVAFESLLWLNFFKLFAFNRQLDFFTLFWLIFQFNEEIIFQIKIKLELRKIAMVSTISEETHHKMSKKIAQLTKVIFHLHSKNEENS